ncbi:MAG: hypothetical protein V4538_15705 [Bacteroidota bacterium]
MKESELIFMGFKKYVLDDYYWYELLFENHRFISNDNSFNEGKDEWHLAYENTSQIDDIIWLDNKINTSKKFMDFFTIVTDKLFSINGKHTLINHLKN